MFLTSLRHLSRTDTESKHSVTFEVKSTSNKWNTSCLKKLLSDRHSLRLTAALTIRDPEKDWQCFTGWSGHQELTVLSGTPRSCRGGVDSPGKVEQTSHYRTARLPNHMYTLLVTEAGSAEVRLISFPFLSSLWIFRHYSSRFQSIFPLLFFLLLSLRILCIYFYSVRGLSNEVDTTRVLISP